MRESERARGKLNNSDVHLGEQQMYGDVYSERQAVLSCVALIINVILNVSPKVPSEK